MRDQHFYGHGKVLLTGEYFVMEGALALGLPTTVGQQMTVKYRHSYKPTLEWRSLDHTGKVWFDAQYEFWHFNPIKTSDMPTAQFLQKLLQQVRKQNIHFLRDEVDVIVETKLEFPLEWGLGSSSSLIYNIAQWAYVAPFELQQKTLGGSGYDVACAQSMGPIHYQLKDGHQQWRPVHFAPEFSESLYLVYLGKKQDSREGIARFNECKKQVKEMNKLVEDISSLTKEMTAAIDLRSFNRAIREHEELVGKTLDFTPIKQERFSDYWGDMKSLGAWGGDFMLVTSEESFEKTRNYFAEKNYHTVIALNEMICGPREGVTNA